MRRFRPSRSKILHQLILGAKRREWDEGEEEEEEAADDDEDDEDNLSDEGKKG